MGKVKKPDLAKLAATRDVDGLIQALSYGERRQGNLGRQSYEEVRVEVAEVVRGAISALAELGDPRAIAPILQCFDENAFNIFQIVGGGITSRSFESLALSKFGASAIEQLVATLAHPSDMRALAAAALGHIGDTRAISPLLALGDPTHPGYPDVAIWAFGNIGGNGKVVEVLIGALGSPYYDRQRSATHVLGSGKFGTAANEALAACVQQGNDAPNGANVLAAVALCELGDPRGLQVVLDVWLPEGTYKGIHAFPWSEESVLMAVGRFDDPRVRKLLSAALEDEHYDPPRTRRVFSALGLARNGDVRAVRPLIEILANPDLGHGVDHLYAPTTFQDLAARALRELGTAAIEPLNELAKDPDPEIRGRAESALASVSAEPPG